MTNINDKKGRGTTKRTQKNLKDAQKPEKSPNNTHFEIHGKGKHPKFLFVMRGGGRPNE